MEADFHQLAQHFDRYPNFAVDLAARMPYLALQPHADVIAFILKYQDRLIYATDLGFSQRDKAPAAIDLWEQTYARDWRFLATNDVVEFDGIKGQGLALPAPVLRKIYHDNAVQWFPGILKADIRRVPFTSLNGLSWGRLLFAATVISGRDHVTNL